MPSHYKEREEAIPIPKPEATAFRNITSIASPTTPAIDVKRPTGYRGEEIERIAAMPQVQRDIAAGHRREFGETPELGLLRKEPIRDGVSEMMPMPMDPETQKVIEAGAMAQIPGQYGPPRPPARAKGTFQYADIMDKVLGPAPTPAVAPVTEGIPAEIAVPTRSGDAAVDLFRWAAYQARTKQRGEQISKARQTALDVSKFEKGMEFKEKKLAAEETGRKSAIDIKRREAIATTAKEADKPDPFVKEARAMALKLHPDLPYLPKEEQDTIVLQEIERTEKLHGRKKSEVEAAGKKKKPSLEAFIGAAKEQGSTMSQEALEIEFKKRYGA